MARIVVIGSVASDEVVHLAERMREGAHLNGKAQGARLGGGGANSAVALAAAGHATSLVSAVGSDATGAWQMKELETAGIDVSGMVRVAGASTRSICLIDPHGERTIVNLGRAQEAAPPHRVLSMPADLVYVRTRAIGLAPVLEQVASNATIVAHVPPIEDGVFPAHVIVCSASDLDAAALADPLAMARRVAGPWLRWVVVTRGPQGAEALSVEGERHCVPAPKVDAVDSVGAGDAFAAGLCHALANGAFMEAALRTGVQWGAAKVGQHGSALSGEAVRSLVE